jgi:hypothetical protein
MYGFARPVTYTKVHLRQNWPTIEDALRGPNAGVLWRGPMEMFNQQGRPSFSPFINLLELIVQVSLAGQEVRSPQSRGQMP